jgi:hypothetical protein
MFEFDIGQFFEHQPVHAKLGFFSPLSSLNFTPNLTRICQSNLIVIVSNSSQSVSIPIVNTPDSVQF